MDNNIFDTYAEFYSKQILDNIGIFGKGISYYAEHKSLVISQNTKQIPNRILEYGCGIGRNIGFLQKYFPTAIVDGYDISEKSLKIAQNFHGSISFFTPNNIRQNVNTYNIALIANVLHHTKPENRINDLKLIKSLLKEKGELFIIEHNPFNLLTRKAVDTCPFDVDAQLFNLDEACNIVNLAGLQVLNKKYTLFFPPPLKFFQPVEKFLSQIPLEAQYFVQAIKS